MKPGSVQGDHVTIRGHPGPLPKIGSKEIATAQPGLLSKGCQLLLKKMRTIMNRRFTHIAPALGISVLGLGLGLAVTACSSASSSGASPAAVTKAPAPPSSAPAARRPLLPPACRPLLPLP
jgi:hypothetical protein